jgi:hypothetical protein
MPPFSTKLNPNESLIFRITHRDNVPWIMANGLWCQSADNNDPQFTSIGNPDLIERRRRRRVDRPPGGTLEDYVPFYFTPFSPMLYNIKTGHGIHKRSNEEIAVIVSSLPTLQNHGVRYVFTDRHAYLQTAQFFGEDDDVAQVVDFPMLQRRDFKRDAEHPEKMDRYQAEALAYRFVPVEAILYVGCYTSQVRDELVECCSDVAASARIVHRTEFYF